MADTIWIGCKELVKAGIWAEDMCCNSCHEKMQEDPLLLKYVRGFDGTDKHMANVCCWCSIFCRKVRKEDSDIIEVGTKCPTEIYLTYIRNLIKLTIGHVSIPGVPNEHQRAKEGLKLREEDSKALWDLVRPDRK